MHFVISIRPLFKCVNVLNIPWVQNVFLWMPLKHGECKNKIRSTIVEKIQINPSMVQFNKSVRDAIVKGILFFIHFIQRIHSSGAMQKSIISQNVFLLCLSCALCTWVDIKWLRPITEYESMWDRIEMKKNGNEISAKNCENKTILIRSLKCWWNDVIFPSIFTLYEGGRPPWIEIDSVESTHKNYSHFDTRLMGNGNGNGNDNLRTYVQFTQSTQIKSKTPSEYCQSAPFFSILELLSRNCVISLQTKFPSSSVCEVFRLLFPAFLLRIEFQIVSM